MSEAHEAPNPEEIAEEIREEREKKEEEVKHLLETDKDFRAAVRASQLMNRGLNDLFTVLEFLTEEVYDLRKKIKKIEEGEE